MKLPILFFYNTHLIKHSGWKVSFLFYFWLGLNISAFGQNKIWDETYGGSAYDSSIDIIPTPDGGSLVGGTSSSNVSPDKSENSLGYVDYWIIKTDVDGKKIWDKTFGGHANDYFNTLIPTPDEGFLLGGYSESDINGDKSEGNKGNLDQWVIKIDKNGQKQWDRTFGGSNYDNLHALANAPDGGYLLGGYSYSNAGGDKSENSKGEVDYWVVKIDENGQKQWDKTFGTNDCDFLETIVPTPDGGYLLGGTSAAGINGDKSEPSKGNSDYWLVKIDSNGIKQWDKTFGGSEGEELQAMILTKDNGYLLNGVSYSSASGDKSENNNGWSAFWVLKINENGQKQWDKSFGGSTINYGTTLVATTDDGFLVGGVSDSNESGDKSEPNRGNPYTLDFWALKIDGNGQKQWDKTLGGIGYDVMQAMVATTDGNFLLGGWTNSDKSWDKSEASLGGADLWLVKLGDITSNSCRNLGSILREQWNGINGILVKDIPWDTTPSSSSLLNSFEGPSNISEVYGSRIRGYICAPQTGYYTFWIAGDNEVQLWLSQDSNPENKVQIAYHRTWTAPRSWFENASQQSAPIALTAGQRYYVEALHKEGTRDDHLAVSWQLPDGTKEAPIPGSRLSPYETDNPISDMGNTMIKIVSDTGDQPETNLKVFPNPFFKSTTVAFTPQQDGQALLELLSLQGSVVRTIYQGKVTANSLSTHELDGKSLSHGVYLARLLLNGKTYYQRLILIN